jgi:hypothetical protein
VPIYIERFLLPALATLFVGGLLILNPMGLDKTQRITLGIAVVFGAYFLAHTLYKHNQSKENTPPQLKEPTFTEGFDVVTFTVGGIKETLEISDLEKAKRRFSIGDVPAFLYAENGKPYIDIDLYGIPNEPPVRLRQNKLMNRPSLWDKNSDEKALEVVNEKGQPIFQIYYKTDSHIVVNGLFYNGFVPVLAYDEGISTGIDLDKIQYPIKPIFKYPSEKYPSQRITQ